MQLSIDALPGGAKNQRIEESGRKATVVRHERHLSILLEMLGQVVSREGNVLNKVYRVTEAQRHELNTVSSGGYQELAERVHRSPEPPMTVPQKAGNSNDQLYQVTTGPISDRRRIEEIVTQLLNAGLIASVTMQQGQAAPESFRVVSEVLLPSVAQHRAGGLADLHPQQEFFDDGRLRLQFGTFSAQQDATALAEAIRRRGYLATVESTGGPRFVISVNPAPRAVIERGITIIRANGRDLTVQVHVGP